MLFFFLILAQHPLVVFFLYLSLQLANAEHNEFVKCNWVSSTLGSKRKVCFRRFLALDSDLLPEMGQTHADMSCGKYRLLYYLFEWGIFGGTIRLIYEIAPICCWIIDHVHRTPTANGEKSH